MFKKWTNKRNLEMIEAMRKNIFAGFSMAELEKKLKLSHHPVHRRVKQLEKDKIVFRKDGRYRLNIASPETAEILYFLSRNEKLEFTQSFVNDLFRQLEKQFDESGEIEIAVIFGSYARGEQKKNSDLDIFIVSEKTSIDKSFEAMYSVKSSVIFAAREEFIKMIKDRKKIVKDFFNEGIVLKGNIYGFLAKYNAEW